MPSARTSRPMSASTPIVSSLCSRTRPTSLRPTERILPRTIGYSTTPERCLGRCSRLSWQQPLVFCLRWLGRCELLCTGPQRGREFGACRKSVVGRFRQYAVQNGFDALGQFGAHGSDRGVILG